MVEYDRVHYPLPLAHEDVPSVESLQRVIRRLRKVGAGWLGCGNTPEWQCLGRLQYELERLWLIVLWPLIPVVSSFADWCYFVAWA